jgi:hypothetical protein
MNTPKKFRVWNTKSNGWCGTIGLNETISHYELEYDTDDFVFVQYTGLNDSKGNPIYEGDIIEQNFGKKPTRGLVKFSRGSFRVIWPAETYDDLGCMLIEYVTVIGNVFENPKMRGIYE